MSISLPQLLYNRTVEKILSRLARPPNHDSKGKVDPHAVWAQDVVNEVTDCHPHCMLIAGMWPMR